MDNFHFDEWESRIESGDDVLFDLLDLGGVFDKATLFPRGFQQRGGGFETRRRPGWTDHADRGGGEQMAAGDGHRVNF